MINELPLKNRVALVTGASRGIGRGIALALAHAGAHIAINYLDNEVAAQEAATEVRKLNVQACCIRTDIRIEKDVQQMVETVCETLGPVDLLVNNAGIPSSGQIIADTDAAELQQLLDIHLFGSFNCTKATLPFMRTKPRGNIIFISSDAPLKCKAGKAPYSIAKAGIEVLAKTLAKEEINFGIRVNAIAPSLTNTDMGRVLLLRRGITNPEQVAKDAPFGRLVQPNDIGHLCVYLASEQGSYVTGQVLYVDGGGGR